jgi:damage-control phosphatase, subfamily I
MRKTPACHPCAEQQVLRVLEVALGHPDGPDLTPEERDVLEEALLLKVRKHLPTMPEDTNPAELSFDAIKFVYAATGQDDPYSELKKRSNEEAMKHLPELREWIRKSEDPIETAAHLSVAGNIIDLGIQADYDIEESIRRILDEGFAIDHLDRFVEDLTQREAEGLEPEVLYICDNAGEIAFDRIFLETLVERFPKTRFTAAVNGGPILNDALMEDAEMVGLTEVVPVIDNGCDLLGTVLRGVGREFREAFDRADWVISKGQANYETLDGFSDRIVFLLKAKCESIADHVGISLYQGVFKQGDDRLKDLKSPREVGVL